MVVSLVVAISVGTSVSTGLCQEGSAKSSVAETIAMLPWTFQGGTDTAIGTASTSISSLLAASHCIFLEEGKVLAAWELEMKQPRLKSRVFKTKEYMPRLPSPRDLLTLGKLVEADLVVAGRCRWSTDSKWVALGPKTKAWCTVDLYIVDVKNAEIDLESLDVTADSTRVEKGWETAASILVSAGFTSFSGGPKTPHQQRAAQAAIGMALEPWLKEREIIRKVRKKIGETRGAVVSESAARGSVF